MKNNIFEEDRTNFIGEAESLLERNNLPAALNLARERLQLFPADAEARIIACSALVGMGRLDESREILQEVEDLITGLSLVYERAGDIYRGKGFNQDAAVYYEKFISLHPDAEKAREVIGKMTLLEQEDNPAAPTYAVRNENIHEQEFFTTTLAQLYIKQGHLQDAEIILEEIIKMDPQNIHALDMLDKLRVSLVLQSAANSKNLKNDHLIKTLSSWLKNIERLKINATEK